MSADAVRCKGVDRSHGLGWVPSRSRTRSKSRTSTAPRGSYSRSRSATYRLIVTSSRRAFICTVTLAEPAVHVVGGARVGRRLEDPLCRAGLHDVAGSLVGS